MLIASFILFLGAVFAVLVYVFRRIMTKNVVSATSHLEELNREYLKKDEDINKRLEQIKQESQSILAKAREEAENTRTQIIKEAESERERILEQSRAQSEDMMQQADKTRQLLLSEMNEKIEKTAIVKACELIQLTLPEQFKQDVHTHWVEELIGSGFNRLEHLHLPPHIAEAKVVSAFSLTEQQRKGLLKKLKDILGYDVTLKEETDPQVVAGLIIVMGSLVLDGSLKNKIQEQVKNAKLTASE